MVTRTTFKSNKPREDPQTPLSSVFKTTKLVLMVENFNVILMEPHPETVKNPDF